MALCLTGSSVPSLVRLKENPETIRYGTVSHPTDPLVRRIHQPLSQCRARAQRLHGDHGCRRSGLRPERQQPSALPNPVFCRRLSRGGAPARCVDSRRPACAISSRALILASASAASSIRIGESVATLTSFQSLDILVTAASVLTLLVYYFAFYQPSEEPCRYRCTVSDSVFVPVPVPPLVSLPCARFPQSSVASIAT